MASGLSLYVGYIPNLSDEYVMYSTFSAFKTHLSSQLLCVVLNDYYSINNGVVRIAVATGAGVLTEANYKSVSYMINEPDNVCYHVRRVVLQSGYVIFEVTVDYWGTFFSRASFDIIDVVRCNRRVGVGLYDAIRATNEVTRVALPIPANEQVSGKPLSLKNEKAYAVFTIEYAVENQITGSITTTEVFCIDLKTLKDAYETQTGVLTANAVDIACAIIGGIVEAKAGGQTPFATLNARVLHAYLVPADFIFDTPFTATTFVSKSRYGDYELIVGKCPTVTRTMTFTVANDPDYEYYVGTVESGLKLVRTTDANIDVTYRCSANVDGLKITVEQGDNQIDITSNFEIALTLNAGDVTNLSGIKTVLQYSLKGIGSMATGNIIGLAADTLGMIGQHHVGSTINGGDGAVAMRAQGPNASTLYDDCRYPLAVIKCKSINDEQDNAKYKGAFFDAYMASFSAIFSAPLLFGTNEKTYIQANVTINNLPAEAHRTIKSALASGLYAIMV